MLSGASVRPAGTDGSDHSYRQTMIQRDITSAASKASLSQLLKAKFVQAAILMVVSFANFLVGTQSAFLFLLGALAAGGALSVSNSPVQTQLIAFLVAAAVLALCIVLQFTNFQKDNAVVQWALIATQLAGVALLVLSAYHANILRSCAPVPYKLPRNQPKSAQVATQPTKPKLSSSATVNAPKGTANKVHRRR